MGWIETVEVRPGRGQRQKDGRWLRFRGVYRDPDGTKHRKSFDRREDARRWSRHEEANISRDEWQPPSARKAHRHRLRRRERVSPGDGPDRHDRPRSGGRALAGIPSDDH